MTREDEEDVEVAAAAAAAAGVTRKERRDDPPLVLRPPLPPAADEDVPPPCEALVVMMKAAWLRLLFRSSDAFFRPLMLLLKTEVPVQEVSSFIRFSDGDGKRLEDSSESSSSISGLLASGSASR